MSWVYVPGLGGSNSESNLPIPPLEPSVTSSGKPFRLRSWSSAWRKGSWIRLLSGLTWPPSTAARGVAWWILSLRGSRANLSRLPERGEGRTTSVGCGPTSSASFARWDQASSSWRTSEGSSVMGSGKSSRAWPVQGSMRSGACSRQPELVPPIGGSGCSSWPTPAARDWRSGEASEETFGRNSRPLSEVAGRWPSPTCGDAKASGSAGYARTATHNPGTTLTDAVVRSGNWHTPREAADKMGRPRQNARDDLQAQAQAMFPTPMAADGERRSHTLLRGETNPTLLGAAYRISLPFPEETGPASPSASGRLNPAFVEWMMGWPHGWTACGPVGTGWSLWLRQSRSALSRLESTKET